MTLSRCVVWIRVSTAWICLHRSEAILVAPFGDKVDPGILAASAAVLRPFGPRPNRFVSFGWDGVVQEESRGKVFDVRTLFAFGMSCVVIRLRHAVYCGLKIALPFERDLTAFSRPGDPIWSGLGAKHLSHRLK